MTAISHSTRSPHMVNLKDGYLISYAKYQIISGELQDLCRTSPESLSQLFKKCTVAGFKFNPSHQEILERHGMISVSEKSPEDVHIPEDIRAVFINSVVRDTKSFHLTDPAMPATKV